MPCRSNSRTPSGVMATRCSAVFTSRGTPTVRTAGRGVVITSSCHREHAGGSGAPTGGVDDATVSVHMTNREAPRVALGPAGSPGWLEEAIRSGGGEVVQIAD